MKSVFQAMGEATMLVFGIVCVVSPLVSPRAPGAVLVLLFGFFVLAAWRFAANWGKR